MKRFLAAIIIITTALNCKNANKQPAIESEKIMPVAIDSTLVTDSSWGPVTKNADIASLLKIYGNANVKDERICGPECADSIDVTRIYPDTNSEFTVYWKDSLYHRAISFIETRAENSPYHTAAGLKTGSTLQDLLKENGKPISFSGFGWDYGGYIQSFQKGNLDKTPIGFRLDVAETNDNFLLGDTELSTEMPAVKKALDKITVWTLSLSFIKEQ